MLRNFIRTLSLVAAVTLILYGFVNGFLSSLDASAGGPTDPPDDSVWLICLGAAFVLLVVYAGLSIDSPGVRRTSPDARFRYNVQQLGAFLLVGFALLSVHLLREQIVAAAAIKGATVVTEEGHIIQDPRRIPEQLRIRRGAIYAGDRVIAASEVISPSRYVHRIYPEPNISYLAGYFNPTIYGSAGLEAQFDAYLSGGETLNPLVEQQRRLLNRPIIGNDLRLTIDPALQDLAHNALDQRRGAVVLLDAQTGAILALASWPHIDPQQMSFNPNSENWGDENRRIMDYYTAINSDPSTPLIMRATQGLYPPGSTFKTVTTAAALDTGTAQATSVYTDADGTIKVEPGNYVHQDCPTCRPRNHGPRFTLTEGYKWSLNVVYAQVAMQLGPTRLIEYAQRFGFGTRYDLGVPVEPSRLASDLELLNGKNLLAATAYGQGEVQATPLQMALVAATVARGGEMPTPYLVASVSDPETGAPVWQFEPRPMQRAISPQTNDALKEMMIESVRTGWARAAGVEGATVGGKTGSAETGRGTVHSWFIGFAGQDPNQPRYAIAVIVEDAGEGTRVALPLAREVLVAALGRQ